MATLRYRGETQIDIFDYWKERKEPCIKPNNDWRNNAKKIVDIINSTIEKYSGRRMSWTTFEQIEKELLEKGLSKNTTQCVLDAIQGTANAEYLWCSGVTIEQNFDSVGMPGDMFSRYAISTRREPDITPTFEIRPVTSLTWDLETMAHDYDGDRASAVSH